ncbi:hypothetical protein FOZ62_000995 [Perkinsus olseni]|uniref:C3H1-type domain-containing protein n=1 Tax=Perkinsus olseni TaxID=32597 RepID=A0A7J6SAS6_PEROL|nr:hypothetical protein FOZ62_000995 [Perkinsus olseni]
MADTTHGLPQPVLPARTRVRAGLMVGTSQWTAASSSSTSGTCPRCGKLRPYPSFAGYSPLLAPPSRSTSASGITYSSCTGMDNDLRDYPYDSVPAIQKGSTVPGVPRLEKTKACRHFVRGYCALGHQCRFAHHPSDLRFRPANLYSTKMCDRGRHCRRVNCGYAHAEAELFRVKEGCVDDESSQSPYVQYIDQMAVLLKKGNHRRRH